MARVRIERLAHGGDSIARLDDGRTAFVTGGCPGDVADIEIVEDRKSYVRARVAALHSSGADRVAPACPYFSQCGGCDWQHVSYDAQLAAKRTILVDALQRIGKLEGAEAIVETTVASPQQLGYRNKIELAADASSGRLKLGFHGKGSAELVPVDECLLLPKRFRKAPRSLAGALRYVSGESDLGILRVGLRVAANTKDVEPAVWTSPGHFPRKPVANTLSSALPTTSIVRVLMKGPVKERKVSGVEVLSGKGMWRERMAGFEYLISAPSFFQVNTKAAEKLVLAALEHLEPDGSDRVLDLYSGAGSFTLPLASVAGEVVAVESAGSAVRDLRRNLESQQLWADVIGGDAARELPALGGFDIVLVDPPRAGLGESAIRDMAAARPRLIGYVSCDPSTFARDASSLRKAGYTLSKAIPFDLFPQTYHVETLGVFTRED